MKSHANVCYITTRSVNFTWVYLPSSLHVLSTNTLCRLHVFSSLKPFKDQYCMMQNRQFYKGNAYKKSVFLLLLSLLTLFRKNAKLPSFLVESILSNQCKTIAFEQNFFKTPMKIISCFLLIIFQWNFSWNIHKIGHFSTNMSLKILQTIRDSVYDLSNLLNLKEHPSICIFTTKTELDWLLFKK